ncbi:MAG TPA: thiamine phosphate synthase, partial [Blastocatellia bacterium]|nr:thiamine phosphate synthase [Blastocatellia bacterium]
MKLTRNHQAPLLYLITDRRILAQTRPGTHGESELIVLVEFIEEAIDAGVDLIQLRERDLSGRELYDLAKATVRIAAGTQTRILINDRADIAASLGAGVHLTTRSMTAGTVRETFGEELLIGVSTHNLIELEGAERGGADFVVFGPVFETESKKEYGPPVGLETLRAAAAATPLPVLALGGINTVNHRAALEA